MSKITKDMNVFEVLDLHPQLEKVFLDHGLSCLGCPGSSMENIEEAADGHGVDLQTLLNDLNNNLEQSE